MTEKFTTITLDWQPTTSSTRHDFEATENGNVYRAYRHRSDYGWSWFTITKNGEPTTINSGRSTELPRMIQEWR